MEQTFILEGERVTVKLAGRLQTNELRMLNAWLSEMRYRGYTAFTLDLTSLDSADTKDIARLISQDAEPPYPRLTIQQISGEIRSPSPSGRL